MEKTKKAATEIIALNNNWHNLSPEETETTAEKISNILKNEEEIKELIPLIKSLSLITGECFDRIISEVTDRETVKKLFNLSRRHQDRRERFQDRRERLLIKYQELLETEFNKADLKRRLEIFKNANQDGEGDLMTIKKNFCRRHWQELIHTISGIQNGLPVYQALLGDNNNPNEIWASVAALKIIKYWTLKNSLETIDLEQAELMRTLKSGLKAEKIPLAQMILQKIEN